AAALDERPQVSEGEGHLGLQVRRELAGGWVGTDKAAGVNGVVDADTQRLQGAWVFRVDLEQRPHLLRGHGLLLLAARGYVLRIPQAIPYTAKGLCATRKEVRRRG